MTSLDALRALHRRFWPSRGGRRSSFDVLYIVWVALLLYNIAEEAGAIRSIGVGVATGRPQVLPPMTLLMGLLGWLAILMQ